MKDQEIVIDRARLAPVCLSQLSLVSKSEPATCGGRLRMRKTSGTFAKLMTTPLTLVPKDSYREVKEP